MKNYQVLILSAGTGSRMKELSKIPKCLNKINDITLIERILNDLCQLGLKDIYMTVGYKGKIIEKFLTQKKYKVKFIRIKNYSKCGSVYSWFKFKKTWNKKKNLILLHSDLIFDITYIKNLLNNKKNIISGSDFHKNSLKPYNWMCTYSKEKKITKLLQNNWLIKERYKTQIACINKFYPKTMNNFFKFMENYFKIKGIQDTWEIVLNEYMQESKNVIFLYNNKKYWFNINSKQDLKKAEKFLSF